MTHYVNLIQRHKRTAATVALLGSTLMFSACGEEPKAPIEFTLGKVDKINAPQAGNISEVLFNKDRSLAYVKNDQGGIFRVDAKDGIKAFSDNTNWKALTLRNDSAAGTVGLAKLNEDEPNPRLRKLFLAKDGLLVLAQLRTAAPANLGALAYFGKDKVVPTNAWTSDAAHVAAAALAANSFWVEAQSVIMSDGKERFVVANAAFEVSSVEVGPNQFTGQHAKATPFVSVPKIADDKDNVFFVSASGVSVLEKSKLNATNPIPDETTDAKSVKWDMVPGAPNFLVSQIVLHNGKIYISLVAGLNQGGIAVYNVSEKTTVAPNASVWHAGTQVSNLHVEGDKVRAVLNSNLIDIKADGTPGDTVFSLTNALSNKFTQKGVRFGDDLAEKTQYQFLNAVETFTLAYKLGNDVLFGNGVSLYSVIYESKSIKAPKEVK